MLRIFLLWMRYDDDIWFNGIRFSSPLHTAAGTIYVDSLLKDLKDTHSFMTNTCSGSSDISRGVINLTLDSCL